MNLLTSSPAVAVLLLVCALLAGCTGTPVAAPPAQRFVFERAAMGTRFRITTYSDNEQKARNAADMAFDRIDALEEVLSDYQADSELSLLREATPGEPVKVSRELFDVLAQARQVSEATDGAFDITIGPYTRLWRFSRKRGQLPFPGELAAAKDAVGFRNLVLNPAERTVTLLKPGMRLDAGGIAKGYAADEALAVLKQQGLRQSLVAASGDIVAGDAPPGRKGWVVEIAHPTSTNRPLRTLTLRNSAVSTSGDSEQFVKIDEVIYSHIADPGTGLGMTNRVQCTVTGPRGALTDPLATALRILGRDGVSVLRQFPGTAAVIVEAPNPQRKHD